MRKRLNGYMTGDNRGFDTFMEKVEAIVAARTGGLSVYDLPDIDYRSMYEDGARPAAAAARAIKELY